MLGATVDWSLLSVTDLFLIFIFILGEFLALVIIGGFVYWFGCSLLFFQLLLNFFILKIKKKFLF